MAESWKVKNRRWHANLGMMAAVTLGLIALSCPFIAHKWDGDVGKTLKRIHYGEFLPANLKWIWIDSQGFFLAFLVVSGWLMHKKTIKQASRSAAEDPSAAGSSVTVLDLDEKGAAQGFVTKAQAKGLRAFLCPVSKFADLNLSQEKWLVVVGTETPLSDEQAGLLSKNLESLRPASLKRLEFSLQPPADTHVCKELQTALVKAGAKEITTSASNAAAWAAQLLVKLCSRTASPAAKGSSTAEAPSVGSAGVAAHKVAEGV